MRNRNVISAYWVNPHRMIEQMETLNIEGTPRQATKWQRQL